MEKFLTILCSSVIVLFLFLILLVPRLSYAYPMCSDCGSCGDNPECCCGTRYYLKCGSCYQCGEPQGGYCGSCNNRLSRPCVDPDCQGCPKCYHCCYGGGDCIISSNFTTDTTFQGCTNGRLTISGGLTTVKAGHTLIYKSILVSGGSLLVQGTLKYNTACN